MKNFYEYMLTLYNHHPRLKAIVIFIAKITPLISFLLYIMVLCFAFMYKSEVFLTIIIKPLIAFLIVTLLRKLINRARPFETYGFTPLVSHSHGESFPSRHTLSSTIIGLVSFYVSPVIGTLGIINAILVSLSRLLTCVHYPNDIVSAIIVAVIVFIIN